MKTLAALILLLLPIGTSGYTVVAIPLADGNDEEYGKFKERLFQVHLEFYSCSCGKGKWEAFDLPYSLCPTCKKEIKPQKDKAQLWEKRNGGGRIDRKTSQAFVTFQMDDILVMQVIKLSTIETCAKEAGLAIRIKGSAFAGRFEIHADSHPKILPALRNVKGVKDVSEVSGIYYVNSLHAEGERVDRATIESIFSDHKVKIHDFTWAVRLGVCQTGLVID